LRHAATRCSMQLVNPHPDFVVVTVQFVSE